MFEPAIKVCDYFWIICALPWLVIYRRCFVGSL